MKNLFVLNPVYESRIRNGKRIQLAKTMPKTPLGYGYWIWAIVYLIMGVLFVGILVIGDLEKQFRFLNSVNTGAVVQICEFQPAYHRTPSKITITYRYGVANPDGENREYTSHDEISYVSVTCPQVPETIWIQYLPTEPSQSRVNDPVILPSIAFRGFIFLLTALYSFAFLANSIYFLIIGIRWLLEGKFWKLTNIKREYERLNHLEQYGMPLRGEIVRCEGEIRKNHYEISLTYRFIPPSGKTIENRTSFIRDDLQGKPLPSAGIQVAILYADDSRYMVL